MTFTDKYDLSRKSISGVPGFELFQDESNGWHFFHFNGEDGEAIIYSQPYGTTKNLKTGMNAVKKNAIIDGRYVKYTKEDTYYFTLKAGNHKEIARSCFFSSRSELEKAKRFMGEFFLDETKEKETKKKAK